MAARRWNQLEADPGLAGPWHQLFRQVQSPRNVVSELLQNADDARAPDAIVLFDGDEFAFVHHGEDFDECQFESLCNFGYSNKRALHTIGFRGVGFKSVFSLGDEVRVLTPSLSVAFDRVRFTQPRWLDSEDAQRQHTEIRISVRNQERRAEVERSLHEWARTPLSLLFLRHVRSLRLDNDEVRWEDVGPGPTHGSRWMALSGSPDQKYLLLRSPGEGFPREAMDEIRLERVLATDEDATFPPCHVEIVVGSEGRLFVVLPTHVLTGLPFACNAPFIQDPARIKIKDPAISPTNRWLLRRVGEFAADAMLAWLGRSDLELPIRAEAYGLMPKVASGSASLEDSCAAAVQDAFGRRIEGAGYILTEQGELIPRERGCIALPDGLVGIWTPDQCSALFDERKRPVLCRHVVASDRRKLIERGAVEKIDVYEVVRVLEATHAPKPRTWDQLLSLWALVADDVAYHLAVRIVRARGSDVLHAAGDVVRLGDKKIAESPEDWEFLLPHVLVMDQNWPRFLAKQRQQANESGDEELGRRVDRAYAVLHRLGLENATSAKQLIQQAVNSFRARDGVRPDDWVRLAHIAAALDAEVADTFGFVTRDGVLRSPDEGLVADVDGTVDEFASEEWGKSHVLHDAYSDCRPSCTVEQWKRWVSGGRCPLGAFIPLRELRKDVWGERGLRQLLRERGCRSQEPLKYQTVDFLVYDWDFDESLWGHWEQVASQNQDLWGRLGIRVLSQAPLYWPQAAEAHVDQVSMQARTHRVATGLTSAWIVKLRSLPCLPDSRGVFRQPADLLCRTPNTEPLLDVEPFVDGRLDTEANRPLLLALGVRDTPTGPDALLDRLRALSQAEHPPVYEVEKWYRKLDHLVDSCSTEDLQRVKDAFSNERLILSDADGWVRTSEVFLSADPDDTPGVPTVLPSVRDLALWVRVGVASRPTADMALAWLNDLPSGGRPSPDEANRVKSLLARHAERIWVECGHWLSLDGTWVRVSDLEYALTMQSLVSWANLFSSVKQKTADFQRLQKDVLQMHPFSGLPALASLLEDRFAEPPSGLKQASCRPWLERFGDELGRARFQDDEETARVRALAGRLAATVWQEARRLEITPYLDGTPVGTPRPAEALWHGETLYVDVGDRPIARLATPVVRELHRAFRRDDVRDALNLCFERPPDFVSEYLADSFKLIPPDEACAGRDGSARVPPASAGDGQLGTSAAAQEPEEQVEPGTAPSEGLGVGSSLEGAGTLAAPAEGGDAAEQPVRRKQPEVPCKPSVMERFAALRGFCGDGPDRFYRHDGSWIAKVTDGVFPWEHRTASGKLIRYWVKDHCFIQKPLQMEAEVWGLCIKFPDTYSLVLVEMDGTPVEYPGHKLTEMLATGELSVHPATYRIVHRDLHER